MRKKSLLSPSNIDSLARGSIADSSTPGLSIEAAKSGKKTWVYRRRIARDGAIFRVTLGTFPSHSIADARRWAARLNEKLEAGIDPRVAEKVACERARMTVDLAHCLYMSAVREGRASRAKRVNKPRTIADKQAIYECDIERQIGSLVIYDVTEAELTKLVLAKGKESKVRANRLATELKVFFGWAASLRGTEVGLEGNPAARLADLKFPESPRTRKLSMEEIGWFLRSLTHEPRNYQRGLLLLLLTAARLSEVIRAKTKELEGDVWVIPEDRAKNSRCHRVALGPWGRSLFRTESEWVFPSSRGEGPQAPSGWYKARNRVVHQMSVYARRPVALWTPHDMRRTARSNTKRLHVDFETAEAMLNHVKKGLERIYDGYELEDEKREWFLKWETEIVAIAKAMGVASALGVPEPEASGATGSPLSKYSRHHITRGRGFRSMRARRQA